MKGRGERLTGGVAVSVRAKKRKRERERGGTARGELDGPTGLAGPKGERVRFFSFLFQTPF
jgi:hypothetical protein